MKRAIIFLAIFFLAISGVFGAAYPGGFFRDSIDMRGNEITNASNLATTSDIAGFGENISKLQKGTTAINETIADIPDYSGDISNLQKGTTAINKTIGDLRNTTSGITDNVSDLQSSMTGVLAGTFQLVETVMLPGEAAGNHAVFAITANDFLDKVYYMHVETGALVVTDITSEFRGGGHSSGVVTDGLINNDNGTNTTGGYMVISWYTRYMLFGA